MAAAGVRTLCLSCLHDTDRIQPYDPDGECARCSKPLTGIFCLIPDEYYETKIRQKIYKSIMRMEGNEYVSHSMITIHVDDIPLEFLRRFCEKIELAARRRHEERRAKSNKNFNFDAEGPRTQWRDFPEAKSWLYTTWDAVEELACLQILEDSCVPEDEAAYGNMRQMSSGDCIFLLPPLEVSWQSEQVTDDIALTTLTIKASTGTVAMAENTHLRLSASHPVDTSETANLLRWPHLPLYDNYQLYVRWKCRRFLRCRQRFLLFDDREKLLSSITKTSWEVPRDPVLVNSRIPLPQSHHRLKQLVVTAYRDFDLVMLPVHNNAMLFQMFKVVTASTSMSDKIL